MSSRMWRGKEHRCERLNIVPSSVSGHFTGLRRTSPQQSPGLGPGGLVDPRGRHHFMPVEGALIQHQETDSPMPVTRSSSMPRSWVLRAAAGLMAK